VTLPAATSHRHYLTITESPSGRITDWSDPVYCPEGQQCDIRRRTLLLHGKAMSDLGAGLRPGRYLLVPSGDGLTVPSEPSGSEMTIAKTAPASIDPVADAKEVWLNLVAWQPALAVALAARVQALPEDWTRRVFGCGRAEAALELPSGASRLGIDDHAPEVAPWTEDLDQCEACAEAEGMCRYHKGCAAGQGPMFQLLLQAVQDNPATTVKQLLDQYIEQQETTEA
jgi:hypothetical protein